MYSGSDGLFILIEVLLPTINWTKDETTLGILTSSQAVVSSQVKVHATPLMMPSKVTQIYYLYIYIYTHNTIPYLKAQLT